MLTARAKIESLGTDSKTVEMLFRDSDYHDSDEKRKCKSLADAVETIQPDNLRIEVAEQLLNLNIKQNNGRLLVERPEFASCFVKFLSPTYAKKLVDSQLDEIAKYRLSSYSTRSGDSEFECFNYDVVKLLLEAMDRKDAQAIFDDTRKRTLKEKNRIKFGAFHSGMSDKDVIVTSIAIGLNRPPSHESYSIDGVGYVSFLVFPRGLRYKLLEAEDLDFWDRFLNECVPLEKGETKYYYIENSDGYLYKSIKHRTIVTYDIHSGTLRLGKFGED